MKSGFCKQNLNNSKESGTPIKFSVFESRKVPLLISMLILKEDLDPLAAIGSKYLTPHLEFQVIEKLNDPKLGFKFLEFSRQKFKLDRSFWTYNMLLRSLCDTGSHDLAKIAYGYMRIDGYFPDDSLLGYLVLSFIQAGKNDIANKLMNEVGGSPFVYNNVLIALVEQNQVTEALRFFREQRVSKFRHDTRTFNILVKGLCRTGKVDKGFQLFSEMGSFGCSADVVTYNTIIDGLCKTHQVDRGLGILKEVQLRDDCSPNCVTYTSIISGYSKLGKMTEASNIFNEMVDSGTKPNERTFNVLIDGFGKIGGMALAELTYNKMLWFGCIPDVFTFTCLIGGYCRSGQVDQGLKILHEMSSRNVTPNAYTYAILINALCKANRLHEARDFLSQLKYRDFGRMLEAISIFNNMLNVGCVPDDIAIRALIPHLLKAGMHNEAFRIKKLASERLNLGLSSSENSIS
ncbi:hypothetical protein ACFE04_017957 [Oxalis oulophora]